MEHEYAVRAFRLEGLEPDNLLAFLALLGTLRALEALPPEEDDVEGLRPRVRWDLQRPPLRPVLLLGRDVTKAALMELVDRGLDGLAEAHDFGDRRNFKEYTRAECRQELATAAVDASLDDRARVDLLAALMTDAGVKPGKDELQPTPLCLQFGQGHQHFLKRLTKVPAMGAPPPRGRGRKRIEFKPVEVLSQALLEPWVRQDLTDSFRWDPDETARYAQMPGNPTDAAYKLGTQHGANRLAAVGLAALALAPVRRRGSAQVALTAGAFERGFSMAWPIWRDPASLAAIRSLLAHPELRTPGALEHLGVVHVQVARRISVGKFMNVTRADTIPPTDRTRQGRRSRGRRGRQ